MERIRVELNGPPQTMLATLYAKALDADARRSVLADRHAKVAVARIDYDWEALGINAREAPSVAIRTLHFDNWTRQFLAAHEQAHQEVAVLHVGCGLDARVHRLDPPGGVRWYDIDYPEVIALRERIYPDRANYRMLAASVTDPSWLAEIPADTPALLVGEGLTPYLTRDDGLGLLRRVVDRFPSGELQFDAFSTFGIRAARLTNPIVRRSGSRLHWAINGPSDVIDAVPAARLLVWQSAFESDAFDLLTPVNRWLGKALAAVAPLRKIGQYHRYAFGQPEVGKA